MTAKANDLHVCIESFACTHDGRQLVVRQDTRWRGEIVRLHQSFFVPVDEADELTIGRARAAWLQAGLES